jgi:hypothetical protein
MTIARDLSFALDATKLAEACGVMPDEWQRDMLRTMPRRGLLLCARQTGKSTATALIALRQALYTPFTS